MSQTKDPDSNQKENNSNLINDNTDINSANHKSIIDLKEGEFIFTPIETMIINKKMPLGFKLDTEENIIKSNEFANQNKNRKKKLESHRSRTKKIPDLGNITDEYNDDGKKYLRQRKVNQKDQIMKPENKMTSKEKCEKCLEILKSNSNQLFQYFYNSIKINSPSLSQIEKNIKNNKYSNTYEFFMDLRKIWFYYYQNYPTDPEIYEKTSKMSKLSEDLCKNVDNLFEDNNHEFHNIKQKLNHFEKDLNDYKTNSGMINQNKNFNNMNNSMSIEEKNNLGNAIRNLNKQQLKGIIKLLSDSKLNQQQSGQTKYFEFDIDKLPIKKLRELEKYVKDCEKETNNNIHNNKEQNEQIRKLKHDLSNKNIENENNNIQNNSENKKSNLQNLKNSPSASSSSSDSESDSSSTLNK